mmetsp:Transcript_31441/g.44055  ORF Transcript_31441/g.44055 Transcript_31441/m.44055 type:complete len:326 (+) Transcript_31441:239-1216(+)
MNFNDQESQEEKTSHIQNQRYLGRRKTHSSTKIQSFGSLSLSSFETASRRSSDCSTDSRASGRVLESMQTIKSIESSFPSMSTLYKQEQHPIDRLGNFSIVDLKVSKTSHGSSVVNVEVTLEENGLKKEISFDFDFKEDSYTKLANGVLEEFKDIDSGISMYPEHVEMVAKRMSDALQEYRLVYTKERELHAKMALEETLIKARLLSDRDLIMSNLVNEGIFVEDLLYGAVTEVELKEFIPKIGPRKRLLRSLQTERERRRRSSTEIVIRNDGTTSPMMTTGNYSKTSCNFQKSTAQTPPPPLTRKNRMAAMSSPLSMPELSSGV